MIIKDFTLGFLCFSLIANFPQAGVALPEGTISVQGEGSFSIVGETMSIKAPDNSIFEHQSFNLSPSEAVVFSQPGEQARVLNRISALSPSLIEGKVQANGELYFLAPGGLIFGQGALIEAGKLHAIAGSLSNENFLNGSERYTGLSGVVENRGAVVAKEVVLAGSQVINSGSIVSIEGVVALGAGGSLELIRNDGSFSVTLSNESDAPIGGAGDLAGQALLQSGIVQASEAHLHGSEITQSGSVLASKASFGSFANLTGSTGSLVVSELELMGGNGNPYSSSSVELASPYNSIGSVKASGAFSSLNLYSLGSVYLGSTFNTPENELVELPTLFVEQGDIRVTGNLTLGVGFAPIFTNSTSGLLLAAKGNLNLGQKVLPGVQQTQETIYSNPYYDSFLEEFVSLPTGSETVHVQRYNRILLYGQNLSEESLAELAPTNEMKMNFLNATSLEMSELSLGLDASSILSLATENPSFTGFSVGDGEALQLEGQQVNLVNEETAFNSEPPNISTPTSVDTVLDGMEPSFNPLSLSGPYPQTSTTSLGVDQLQEAMNFGLFGDYSYFLKAPTSKDRLLASFSESGGTASAFGGSYALVGDKGVGMTEKASDAVDSSDSSESSGEESESASDDAGDDGDGKSSSKPAAAQKLAKARAMGLLPFAPISQPISSPEASAILQEALSIEVERKLEKYLNRKM